MQRLLCSSWKIDSKNRVVKKLKELVPPRLPQVGREGNYTAGALDLFDAWLVPAFVLNYFE